MKPKENLKEEAVLVNQGSFHENRNINNNVLQSTFNYSGDGLDINSMINLDPMVLQQLLNHQLLNQQPNQDNSFLNLLLVNYMQVILKCHKIGGVL